MTNEKKTPLPLNVSNPLSQSQPTTLDKPPTLTGSGRPPLAPPSLPCGASPFRKWAAQNILKKSNPGGMLGGGLPSGPCSNDVGKGMDLMTPLTKKVNWDFMDEKKKRIL
jgi:hypothetical protein